MKRLPLPAKRLLAALLPFAVFCPTAAHAAIESGDILNNVLARYSAVASQWGGIMTGYATTLFWILVAISMVWTFGIMALRNADMAEFFAEFIRFTLFVGFYWWLLKNGPDIATGIINSLRRMGGSASGLGGSLTPSGIVDIGFDIFDKVLTHSTVLAPVDSAVGILISAVILVIMALIGVNMLLLLISAWILAYAGVFFLGFGGSRWTSDMAIAYFKTVLNIAVQLCTITLLVGIGRTFVDEYYASMTQGSVVIQELGIMMIVAIVLFALINRIPPLVGGIAQGGGAGSLGHGFGAGHAIGAAGMAAAAFSLGASAVTAGAANIAGGGQAIMEAYAKASGASGDDPGMMPDTNTGMSDESTSDTGQTPLAAAMGTSASSPPPSMLGTIGSAIGHLTRGTGEVAQQKIADVKESVQTRIDESTTGQIASAIREGKTEPESASSAFSTPSFDQGSLSAGSDPEADTASEIADFVNRTSPPTST